ncbi:MAG: serine hydrolase [Spirochaetaceae bacterium]|jgi:CubicO group peptidase (beta-lactamase class C family)|nr:serine hydrolase [Spirochaetaceae bacterium]
MADYIFGKTDAESKDVQYSQNRLQLLADFYKNLVDTHRVQAAGFLMARKGKVFAHQSLGKLTHKKDSPDFEPNNIKGIASITKVVTATAIMKLVEDGILWMEQPVSTIIKEFKTPMHEKISIRHLLTHTSGLLADPGYFLEPYPSDHFEKLGRKGWLKKVLAGPLQSKPGEVWSYCSLGFGILGEIVSRVSGKHYNDYLQDEIFTPLGMTRSFIEIPEKLFPETCFMADRHEQWVKEDSLKRNLNACPDAGGGVNTTLHDLFKLGQCYLNGGTYNNHRLLGKATANLMTRNQLKNVPAFHWGTSSKDYPQGLGWGIYCDGSNVGPRTYNHEGWGWCSLFVDPDEQFVYVSMVADLNDWDPDVMVKPRTIAWSGLE